MKKKTKTIVEEKIKTALPKKHISNRNFSPSNGLLVEDTFLPVFKRMTRPPLLSERRRLVGTIVV